MRGSGDNQGQASIVARGVHVRYTVPSRQRRSGLQKLLPPPKLAVRAVQRASLVAREGESIGVIGRNGSGKSTLMRVMAGVETPTKGLIASSSQPVLLGVSAALIPALSGADNIMVGLLAMGLSPKKAAQMQSEVIELSALGEAIHRPMRTYSSGMSARLRFAIGATINPRILLIDEALATGDATFMERSENKMAELLESAGTVFLVTHVGETVQKLCTRAIWLHDGEIIADGPAHETAEKYRWWAWNAAKGEDEIADGLLAEARATYKAPFIDFV